MRPALVAAALVGLAAVYPQALRALSAGAASVLLEAAPWLLIPLPAALGCGCTGGPSARSIPAAVLTAVIFGPWVALARLGAAFGMTRLRPGAHDHAGPLAMLERLVPSALLAAAVPLAAPQLDLGHLAPPLQLAAGAALGFFASPCAFGGVALAASLRAPSPLASAAVLCVAGIADLPVWLPLRPARPRDDRFAYLLLAATCALVAFERGAALVHPRWTIPLALASLAAATYAYRTRERDTRAVACAALLLVTAVSGAPAPEIAATETTLADAYAGERIEFTGAVVHGRGTTSLVRYAVVCCRADARPAVVRVAARIDARWAYVEGILVERGGALELVPSRITPIAPPSDPFVYL